MELEIAIAEPNDLYVVLSVLDQAGAWLHSIGITEQWPASFTESIEMTTMMSELIAAGSIFVARDEEGRTVGCFRLERAGEDEVWPGFDDDALNLYMLAVTRRVAGQGVAPALLDWATQYAGALGKQELRLDCWAGNARLRRYYLEAGFESRGDIVQTDHHPDQGAELRTYEVSRFARPTGV